MSPSPAGARPRILVYVQHLLGIGHLMRISRIAAALSERFEVVVASGGTPVPGLDLGGARLVQLTPVKAGEDGFGQLVHEDGSPFEDSDRTKRRDHLLTLFAEFAPDALLIEAFPFGRRQMRFELLPLLDLARSQSRHVLIASSIRDILQEQKKPGRAEETAALVDPYFDLVLVHGSAEAVRLEETFPLATRFADKIVYTGMVGSTVTDEQTGETHDIIVSVGGGAVGEALIHAALEASLHDAFRGLRWLVATGPNMPAAAFDKARSYAGGVTLERFVPNLAQRLRRARVSVSQAGYNTVADILGAGCAAVLVPFAAGGETEQTRRAQMLAERGLAVMVSEDALDPASLAAAVTAALEQKRAYPAGTDVRLDGAQETTRILLSALRSA
ncbi:MAG: glycosyl transferase [Beijerinckiaceae bacterium]|nr:glycosyl transferase [Beijerinckiaceae bacterium]